MFLPSGVRRRVRSADLLRRSAALGATHGSVDLRSTTAVADRRYNHDGEMDSMRSTTQLGRYLVSPQGINTVAGGNAPGRRPPCMLTLTGSHCGSIDTENIRSRESTLPGSECRWLHFRGRCPRLLSSALSGRVERVARVCSADPRPLVPPMIASISDRRRRSQTAATTECRVCMSLCKHNERNGADLDTQVCASKLKLMKECVRMRSRNCASASPGGSQCANRGCAQRSDSSNGPIAGRGDERANPVWDASGHDDMCPHELPPSPPQPAKREAPDGG